MALLFAAALPGLSKPLAIAVFLFGGLTLTVVASIVGFVPALAAALFAPLVVALSDPMWALGATLSDFTLATESSETFATFSVAALAGAGIRIWLRTYNHKHRARAPARHTALSPSSLV